MKTVLLDANVIIRFLLADHPLLFAKAKSLFVSAQKQKIQLYLDEVVAAETIWTLTSFYKIKKVDIVDRLEKLISQNWIINPRKGLLLKALSLYHSFNLDYLDCWLLALSQTSALTLATFDKDLKKKARKDEADEVEELLH